MTTLHRGEAADEPRAARRLRTVAAAGAVCGGLLLLSACQKPTPLATITVGTNSVSSEATCYHDGKDLSTAELQTCVTNARDIKSIEVDPDDTVRFGVDPEIADNGWTIVVSTTQGPQPLSASSTKTYRTIPGSVFFNAQYGTQGNTNTVYIQENRKGVWIFHLKKA
jgi:hypothetical protein